jgi:hypothetical protein
MLFHSYFTTLVGKVVTVELKNDLAITGTLHSVDQVHPASQLRRYPPHCRAATGVPGYQSTAQ